MNDFDRYCSQNLNFNPNSFGAGNQDFGNFDMPNIQSFDFTPDFSGSRPYSDNPWHPVEFNAGAAIGAFLLL